MCIGRRAGGFWLDLASMSPQSHERVFTLRMGAPLPLLCSVNLSAACHVAVPPRCLTEGTHALCRCLIIVFQRHAGYCQTIHSVFCSASIGHFPRIPLFQLFFFYCSVMFQYVLTEEPVIIGQNYLTAPTVG